jgi:opacity protein-like surface antigen
MRSARCKPRILSILCASLALAGTGAQADSPLGWVHTDHISAYTIDARTFELNIGAIAVNEDLDFLGIRDDLLAGTRQLEGDSGDLSGNNLELNVGITSWLSAYYRRQQSELVIDIGEVRSINLVDLDDGLDTTSQNYGFKLNFFESGNFDNARPWRAASLEVSKTANKTNNFKGVLDRITLNSNTVITFTNPQNFEVDKMEDDGWMARLLYSFPLSPSISSTTWIGFAENDAQSGTRSDIPVPSLASAFEQTFSTENSQLLLGASMVWQITPRMPLQLSYEYIRLNDSDLEIISNPNNVLLPSFLRADNLAAVEATDNHTLRGSLTYWITPQFTVSVTGKLFSNQFLGLIPHYSNPLSGSFSDQPYGYAGVHLGFRL